MAKKKKTNQADLTLRNLRAAKKRDAERERRLTQLEERNLKFGARIQRLEERLRDVDGKEF